MNRIAFLIYLTVPTPPVIGPAPTVLPEVTGTGGELSLTMVLTVIAVVAFSWMLGTLLYLIWHPLYIRIRRAFRRWRASRSTD